MIPIRIVSWNVNGIKSCLFKGFRQFIHNVNPDIICCQEVKTRTTLRIGGDYQEYWYTAKKHSYSGTLVLSKFPPLNVIYGLGIEELDQEGRIITLEYNDCYIVNVYIPSVHPHSEIDRPEYRRAWEEALSRYLSSLDKPVIACGDFNVVHTDLDCYQGIVKKRILDDIFLPENVGAFDELLACANLSDAFRDLNPDKEGCYTWWGPKNKSRAENHGSRLDYFLVSRELLTMVRRIQFYPKTVASDHCPILLDMDDFARNQDSSEENDAAIWKTVDWSGVEDAVFSLQKEIAQAAIDREWSRVKDCQRRLLNSWPAKLLAVRSVVNVNSESGIDGVRWKRDAEKVRAARSLTTRGYYPLPNRVTNIVERGKERRILVPVYRDKAMLNLCSYALDPVAEAVADKKSFFSRKGRSALDAHAYIARIFNQKNRPEWVCLIDIKAYYSNILHEFILGHLIAEDSLKDTIKKLLQAGFIQDGELFSLNRGISLGSSLSPILGNMVLDGLQAAVYEGLYGDGPIDYDGGNVIRFADDILISARSKEQANQIMEIVAEFVRVRGLAFNEEKTSIKSIYDGFEYLSRRYFIDHGTLNAEPSTGAVVRIEQELSSLISTFKGSQRQLIEKINQKLVGWASYHRSEDSFMVFRHVDSIVTGLLLARLRDRYQSWHQKTIESHFFQFTSGMYCPVFVLPRDPSIRIKQLAPIPIRPHKPVRLDFNPYIAEDYAAYIRKVRNIQKANGNYRFVWDRQEGRCAICGQEMLPDHEVDIIEIVPGKGRAVDNLHYIHKYCGINRLDETAQGTQIDLNDLIGDMTEHYQIEKSPYWELSEFFRVSEDTPLALNFQEIEDILCDELPWVAKMFKAFWYDDEPDMESPLWVEEGYPFETIKPPDLHYPIARCWLDQGYVIKRLDLAKGRVVFRKLNNNMAGLNIPKEFRTKKLPLPAVRYLEGCFRYAKEHYGI